MGSEELNRHAGRIRSFKTTKQGENTTLDGSQPKTEEEMPYRPTGMANCRYVPNLITLHVFLSDGAQWRKEHLQDRLAQEVAKPDAFSELPFRFTEISKVLLDVASDDLENPDQVRSLLKDLREARQAKSREGLKHLDHSELGVRDPAHPRAASLMNLHLDS